MLNNAARLLKGEATMISGICNQVFSVRRAIGFFVAAVFFASLVPGVGAGETAETKGFATPEEGVKAFVAALEKRSGSESSSIFGPDATELMFSGDPVSDENRLEKFLGEFEKKHGLVPEGTGMVLVVGEKDWPFPIPLAKRGDLWFFDTEAGMDEILDRRIGENELSTIQTMLAIVDAQREYSMEDRDGDGIREYAEKFRSDPGLKNGLYWETKGGESPSPLGELVADARAEGYALREPNTEPVPYHGYCFRMLKEQGDLASGGAFDYIVAGDMIGGFAVVAFPATYGNSGVMTFVANHDGIVFQADLGEETEKIAREMTVFDPGEAWAKVDAVATAIR